jgi:hypothetical protein
LPCSGQRCTFAVFRAEMHTASLCLAPRHGKRFAMFQTAFAVYFWNTTRHSFPVVHGKKLFWSICFVPWLHSGG